MRRPYRTALPITTIRITGQTLTTERNIRVLVTCDYFLYRFSKQAIDTCSCILDQLKRLLVVNLYCFLLDKRGLGLKCGE
jgi:hypothetical protein